MPELYNPNKKESGGQGANGTPAAGDTSPGTRAAEPPPGAPDTASAGGGFPPRPPGLPGQAVAAGGAVPEPVPGGGPAPEFGPVSDAVSSRAPEQVPVPIPSATQADGTAADRIRIGLWGAPRSGKTTYLAALPIAAMQYQRNHEGSWNVTGIGAEANDFLSQRMDMLTRQRKFPPASMGIQNMAWSLQGPEEKGKLGLSSRRPNFVLEIQDAAGEVFLHDHPQQAQLVGQLAQSHGLIYLFDPLGDAEEATESFTYLQATLTQLHARVRDRGELVDGRLPQHMSVCIAKFDHPHVFQPAVEAGWVTQDSVGSQLPRVPREQSEQYFQWMCDVFRGANARMVRDALYSHFDRSRISYYATSAVGFRLNPQHVFDYADYVQPVTVDKEQRIRTSPVPINVLEPLIDLERRIHQDRHRGGKRRGKRQ